MAGVGRDRPVHRGARPVGVLVTYPRDEIHDAPAAGEDRIEWRPRSDGGADADLNLVAPRDLQDASVEIGAVSIEGGRILVHLRVRPRSC